MSGTVEWIGPSGGDWSDPANWSPSTVPDFGDAAVVASRLVAINGVILDGLTVKLSNETEPTAGLTIGGTTLLLGSSSLSIVPDEAVTLDVAPTAIFEVDGTIAPFTTRDDTRSPDLRLSIEGFMRIGSTGVVTATEGSSGGATTIASTGFLDVSGGFLSETADLSNAGLIAIGENGTVEAEDGLSGTGLVSLSTGGTLYLAGGVASEQQVTFNDPTGLLSLKDPGTFAGRISGLQSGDLIDLPSIQLTAATIENGMLRLTEQGAAPISIATTTAAPIRLFLRDDGLGTLVTTSDATRSWAGGIGSWFDGTQWSTVGTDPASAPLPGDTVQIAGGEVELDNRDGSLRATSILLNGSLDSPAAVRLDDGVSIDRTSSIEVAGSAAGGEIVLGGHVTMGGRITASSVGGELVIGPDEASVAPTLTLAFGGGGIVVDAGAGAWVFGTELINNGEIDVLGQFNLAASSRLTMSDPADAVEIDHGGVVSIAGSVGGGNFTFDDGTGTLDLSDPEGFQSTIGAFQQGDVIDLRGRIVTSVASDSDGRLVLNCENGKTVSLTLNTTVDRENVDGRFLLRSDGAGGTAIGFENTAPALIDVSMPIAAVGTATQQIPFSTLLADAFGTTPSGYSSYTLYSTVGSNGGKSDNTGYWVEGAQPGPGNEIVDPAWFLNGQKIVPSTTDGVASVTIPASEIGDVTFQVGNGINSSAWFQVTSAGTDETPLARTNYHLWGVDPSAATYEPGTPLQPSARTETASIAAFSAAYPNVENTSYCPWIGDDVAAGGGATMPWQDTSTDPDANQEGGFWRVAFRGNQNPGVDWSTKIQAGDVVRMGWGSTDNDGLGQHTTTIYQIKEVGKQLVACVYDNNDYKNNGNIDYIGLHDATYWDGTDPNSITIYRIDPNAQYLINGTGSGEYLPGSVFNNLIRPGGGADTVSAGAADNWVQGTAATLDGTDWTDFHLGDVIDVQHLVPAALALAWEPGTQRLQVQSDGTVRAELSLPGSTDVRSFAAYADASGGTAVVPVPVNLSGYAGDAEAALRQAFAPLADAALDVNVQNNADFAAPVSGDINIGLVAAGAGATYDADSLGAAGGTYDGVILTGSAAATVSGGSGGTLLVGNASADQIVAGSVAATLVSGGHGSTLFGNGRSTLIAGTTGAPDILVGGRSGPGDTLLGGSAAAVFFGGAVATVIETGTGGGMVIGGAGGGLVTTEGHATVSGGAGASTVVSHGADLIQGGIGAETVYAGGGATVFGGIGSLEFIGGAGSSTVVGGSGACTLFGGGTGDALFAGNAPNAVLVGGGASDTLVGGSGSALWAAASGGVMVAGNGNETLVGGRNGLNTIFAGQGNATMLAGGSDLFVFSRSSGGGVSTINGFGGGDRLVLAGYGAGAVDQALSSATVSGGNTVLALADNTRITLLGVTNLTAASFT